LTSRYPDVDRLVLAGHSWGVALTLAYLDEHGEAGVDGLVLTDGFDAYDDNAERSFVRLAELADAHAADAGNDEAASWRQVARFAREQADAGAPYELELIVEASDSCAQLEAALDRPEELDGEFDDAFTGAPTPSGR
jgi:pimeloyl-ACP methyl ester carboxylesterase